MHLIIGRQEGELLHSGAHFHEARVLKQRPRTFVGLLRFGGYNSHLVVDCVITPFEVLKSPVEQEVGLLLVALRLPADDRQTVVRRH